MTTVTSAEPKLREKPLSPAMLRELSERPDVRGAVRTISHYGAIAIVGTLIWLVSSIYGRAPIALRWPETGPASSLAL